MGGPKNTTMHAVAQIPRIGNFNSGLEPGPIAHEFSRLQNAMRHEAPPEKLRTF